MKLGWLPKGKDLWDDYKERFRVEGVDTTLDNGWQVNVREHGFTVFNERGEEVQNFDFPTKTK